MRSIHYRRIYQGSVRVFCAVVVGVGLISTSAAGDDALTEQSAREKTGIPKASVRQKSAFQKIQANVSQLSREDRPFHIQHSQRKVESSIDVMDFLDDVYDLHDASGDAGFELVDESSFEGGTNYEIRRVIDGIPVRGTNAVVTVGSDGSILSAIGMVYEASKRNINTPNILRNTAFESCRAE